MRGGRDVLDAEYAAGDWNYLASDSELPRFSVVAGYCARFGGEGSLLEIGCGEGLLPERLGPAGYSRYMGIDLSTVAVERARVRDLPHASFVAADASEFEPDGCFDLVVFHEVLEYMDDPGAVVRRYEQWVAPGGWFVVSQYDSPDNARTRKIWRLLHRRYRRAARAVVSTGPRLSWTIEVLGPFGGAPAES
jgi:2-polyprenyl-3-methyl-5-hydroxy-6-metoxy-1,4-benzoquinol methylase